MKKKEQIKVNATSIDKQVREAEADRRGLSLSAYMLLMSDPDKTEPSDEQRLRDICVRDKAISELITMAIAISKSQLSPLDVKMILCQLAEIEYILKTPSGSSLELT